MKNRNRPFSRNDRLTEFEKRDRHPTLLLLSGLHKLYSLLLQSSGDVQSKNGVDLIEVSIFYKLEKMSGQTVRPIQIKTVALLSYHGHLVFELL